MKRTLTAVGAAALAAGAVPAGAGAHAGFPYKVRVDFHQGGGCDTAVITTGALQGTMDPHNEWLQTTDNKRVPGVHVEPGFLGDPHSDVVHFFIPHDGKPHKVWILDREYGPDGRVIDEGSNYADDLVCPVDVPPPVAPPVVVPPAAPPVKPPPARMCVPTVTKITGPKRLAAHPRSHRNVWTGPVGTYMLDGQVRARNTNKLVLRTDRVGRINRKGRVIDHTRYGHHVITVRGSNGCKAKTFVFRLWNSDGPGD